MGEERERLDGIERVVIKLEQDIKTMTHSVSEMAQSMKQLVDMQMDQKLLKQEMEHRCDVVTAELRSLKEGQGRIWERVEQQGKRMTDLEKEQQKNTMAASVAGKIAWAITSAAITGGAAFLFVVLENGAK
jgi:phage host-nuclease inhibitor protein Gam